MEAPTISEKLNKQRSIIQFGRSITARPSSSEKVWTWGRRLAWFRIHAWGVCDPGFKSQRPHHISSGTYGDVSHHFPLLKILTSPNSHAYSNPASISFWASSTVFAVFFDLLWLILCYYPIRRFCVFKYFL